MSEEEFLEDITGMTSGAFYDLISIRSRGRDKKNQKNMSDNEKKIYRQRELPKFIEVAIYQKYEN